MPGFDGTGPKGSGPMSGGGRGYCMLKLAEKPGEPVVGVAGSQARPVRMDSIPGREGEALLDQLRREEAAFESELASVRKKIECLQQAGDPPGSTGW